MQTSLSVSAAKSEILHMSPLEKNEILIKFLIISSGFQQMSHVFLFLLFLTYFKSNI